VYCKEISTICDGADTQYLGAQCAAACPKFPNSTVSSHSYNNITAGNFIDCRNYHLSVAAADAVSATTHCPHAGPFGNSLSASPTSAVCGSNAVNFCALLKTTCPTQYAEYGGDALCLDNALTLAPGTYTDVNGNTLGCRQYHLLVALTSAAVHCPHTSLNASSTCINIPTCDTFCAGMQTTCAGEFADLNSCKLACSFWIQGDLSDTAVNSLSCRAYHLGVAKTSAAAAVIHCPHAGDLGGGVCGSYCQNYCGKIGSVCTGAAIQYSDINQCLALCPAIPTTAASGSATTGGDSLQCRSYHIGVASVSSANALVHCPHAGLDGGPAVCGSLCDAYCDQMVRTCPTTFFADKATCMTACAAYDATGTVGATSGDTLQCRFYHATVATLTGDLTHCSHASVSGGGVCVKANNACTLVNVDVATKTAANPFFGQGYLQGYTINGVEAPRLCLQTGSCYEFQVTSSCFHPLYLTANSNGGVFPDPLVLTTTAGVNGTSACGGTSMFFTPAASFTGNAYYQCEYHTLMGNSITVSSTCSSLIIATSSASTQSTSTSTSNGFNAIVITASMEYSVALSVSSWIQNAGSVVTLSGQALTGVAITSQSVSLSGDLVLDVSALNVYDGMTFTLINATNITGQWDGVTATSTSECVYYQLDVTYAQQLVTCTLTTVSLCFASIESIVLGIALV
jgi:hypothetical protein